MFTSVDILDVAIQLERNGEKIYRRAVEQTNNPELADLLTWMADQEKVHMELFAELKEKTDSPFDDPGIQEMGREILQDTLDGVGFDLKSVDFSKVEQVIELINVSVEFEKDTVIFYELLQSFVEDDDSRELLQKIIAEENNHVRLLREFVESAQL